MHSVRHACFDVRLFCESRRLRADETGECCEEGDAAQSEFGG